MLGISQLYNSTQSRGSGVLFWPLLASSHTWHTLIHRWKASINDHEKLRSHFLSSSILLLQFTQYIWIFWEIYHVIHDCWVINCHLQFSWITWGSNRFPTSSHLSYSIAQGTFHLLMKPLVGMSLCPAFLFGQWLKQNAFGIFCKPQ